MDLALHRLSTWLLIMGVGVSCQKEAAPPSAPPVAPPTAGPSNTPLGEVTRSRPLQPYFNTEGDAGLPPEKLSILMDRVVFPVTQGKRAALKGTVLKITPDVKGTLFITTSLAMEFIPQRCFDFGTTYTVELQSVETVDGVQQPPPGSSWTYSFSTPPFEMASASLEDVDHQEHTAVVRASFTAPVTPAAVAKALRWSVEGQATTPTVQGERRRKDTSVAFLLKSPHIQPGAKVRVVLQKDVLSSATTSKTRAPSAEFDIELGTAEPWTIKTAQLKEGRTGFYVDVICNDKAVDSGERYFWDRDTGESFYDLSKQCELDAEGAQHKVVFNPPARFSVSPRKHGFRLFGDFKRGALEMTIKQGAMSEAGGRLMEEFTRSFSVPARSSYLSFISQGRYLPRTAWRNLAVNHRNVDQVHLQVRLIPPENLHFWLSDTSETATPRNSNLILDRSLPLKNDPDTLHTSWLDVGSMLPSTTRGVLDVRVSGNGISAKSRILLTDMSLVAKKGMVPSNDSATPVVQVWALDINTMENQSGVELSMMRESGKVLGRCTTGSQGCVLTAKTDDVDATPPFAIVARKGEDLTYIKYADLKVDAGENHVQGEPYTSSAVYRVSLHSDRGVYRPGETAHVTAIVRDRNHVAPQAGLPVDLSLIDPRSKVSRKVSLKTNEAGMLVADLPFAPFADTGSYRVELRIADNPVGSHSFNVEEFVPERMKVTAASGKPAFLLGDEIPVDVEAKYLFGGVPANSPMELQCRLEASTFKPKENANYVYGMKTAQNAKPYAAEKVTGELDEKGKAHATCPAPTLETRVVGPSRMVASVSVFESGSGRASVTDVSIPVHPASHYLGLSTSAQNAEMGKPMVVDGVVVDWNGAVLPKAIDSVEVEYIRMENEYGYYWNEEGGGYNRRVQPVSEGRVRVPVNGGKFSFNATPGGYGLAYVIRVKSGQTQTELELPASNEWAYWGESRVDQTPRPLKPTSLVLNTPPSVRVGVPAEVQFTAPFRGTALFTVETNQVLNSHWMKVDAGTVKWSFPVKEFVPNVYVSVLLIKDPHLESAESYLPDRAFGVSAVTVEPEQFKDNVKLTVPSEVRSNSVLTVELDVGRAEPGTWATVAAVDEGILQLTRFTMTNPLDAIFVRRALGVETFETIGWTMLTKPADASRSTGGDSASPEAARVFPVKPVALWSGMVKVPDTGKLQVRFDVPQYRGALRVMALTSSDKRMGMATASVRVADPLVLQTTLPRFVVQGDELQIPVFVTNLSKGPMDVQVTMEAEPLRVPGMESTVTPAAPIKFLGKSTGTARLEPGKSRTLVFQARAELVAGAAKVRIKAKGGNHEAQEELDVPFKPAGPRERLLNRMELTAGVTDLSPHLKGWIPNSEKTTFWMTGNPYGESFDHLKHLVHYPYGCVEQTTSSTRPLLYVADLLDSVDPEFVASHKIEDMVTAGIHRLLSMQTPSGGLAYWPGDSTPNGWGTAYATHLLLDASKAGYQVPKDRLQEIVKWMEAEVARTDTGDNYWDSHWHGAAKPYLHFVLAMAGKGNKAAIQALIDKAPASGITGQKAEQLYMLKAALYVAGDRRYANDLRNPDTASIQEDRSNDWSFYSDRRRRGFMLSTFHDLFDADAAGEALAQRVAEGLRGRSSYWYSTQELVWGVTGLGKWVRGLAKDFKPGKLVANGKAMEGRIPNAKVSDRTWALYRASEHKSVKLEVPELPKGKVYLLMSSEGVREQPTVTSGNHGMALTRTFRRLDGTELLPSSGVSLADMVFVDITIRNTTGERIQNIALVDRLPAGFEIENPRLGRGGGATWIVPDEQWKVDFLNVRDDRLEVFGPWMPMKSGTWYMRFAP